MGNCLYCCSVGLTRCKYYFLSGILRNATVILEYLTFWHPSLRLEIVISVFEPHVLSHCYSQVAGAF